MEYIRTDQACSFSELLALEQGIFERIQRGGVGALIFAEVKPTVTLGRRANESQDLLEGKEGLNARGVDVVPVSRGGLATYHGPGQWVLFPCERLELLSGSVRGVSRLVHSLLGISQEAFKSFGVDAEVRTGCELGLWDRKTGGKLAQVGVRIDQGIVRHGLSVNIYSTPESFQGIIPCGLRRAKVTNIADVLGVRSFAEKRAIFEHWPMRWIHEAQKCGWLIVAPDVA